MILKEKSFLKRITLEDHQSFYNLMWRIYPPEYGHFWKDDCTFYINNQFSFENLQKELSAKKQLYFFIVDQGVNVGVLRLKFDEFPTKNILKKRVMKLHRIYLDPKAQGKRLGTKTLQFIDEVAQLNEYEFIWLEAMEQKPSAVNFYLKKGYQIFDRYTYDFDLLNSAYRKMFAFGKEISKKN